MAGKLKLEIVHDKNILEIFEEEGQLILSMYPDDPDQDIWLEVKTETQEFLHLLYRLINTNPPSTEPQEEI